MNQFSKLSDALGNSIVVCVDLEATCCDDNSFPRSEMEIIEIGLSVVNTTVDGYEELDNFSLFVRPVIHTQLTKFCTELTTIQQDDVDEAVTWPTVAAAVQDRLRTIAQQYDPIPMVWVSWGDFDRNLIARESDRTGAVNPMPSTHFNLKAVDAAWRNTTKQRGLMGAVSSLGIAFPGTLHRAGDDAKAVAAVLRKIGPGIARSKV